MEEVNFYKPEQRTAVIVWLFDDTLEVERLKTIKSCLMERKNIGKLALNCNSVLTFFKKTKKECATFKLKNVLHNFSWQFPAVMELLG